MTGKDLLEVMKKTRTNEHRFIKWWRCSEHISAIELLDAFLDRAKAGDNFDGFTLLDMEEMWLLLSRKLPGQLTRVIKGGYEVIVWERIDAGRIIAVSAPFEPGSLISLFETDQERITQH